MDVNEFDHWVKELRGRAGSVAIRAEDHLPDALRALDGKAPREIPLESFAKMCLDEVAESVEGCMVAYDRCMAALEFDPRFAYHFLLRKLSDEDWRQVADILNKYKDQ
jgi:hypothetical protein